MAGKFAFCFTQDRSNGKQKILSDSLRVRLTVTFLSSSSEDHPSPAFSHYRLSTPLLQDFHKSSFNTFNLTFSLLLKPPPTTPSYLAQTFLKTNLHKPFRFFSLSRTSPFGLPFLTTFFLLLHLVRHPLVMPLQLTSTSASLKPFMRKLATISFFENPH